MKRIAFLLAALLCILPLTLFAGAEELPGLTAPSAILMEKTTGTVLYEHNADMKYEPASVTKVMTLLLVLEAISSAEGAEVVKIAGFWYGVLFFFCLRRRREGVGVGR